MTGGEKPLLEELLQVLSRDVFHHFPEIGRQRIIYFVAIVVGANALPEVVIAQAVAQHVQHPSPFLIGIGIEELVVIRHRSIDDGRRAAAGVGEYRIALVVQALDETLAALLVFHVKIGEIGGEAFTKP